MFDLLKDIDKHGGIPPYDGELYGVKGLAGGRGDTPNQHDIVAIRDAEYELSLGSSLDAVPAV
jgi:hypothetical protein